MTRTEQRDDGTGKQPPPRRQEAGQGRLGVGAEPEPELRWQMAAAAAASGTKPFLFRLLCYDRRFQLATALGSALSHPCPFPEVALPAATVDFGLRAWGSRRWSQLSVVGGAEVGCGYFPGLAVSGLHAIFPFRFPELGETFAACSWVGPRGLQINKQRKFLRSFIFSQINSKLQWNGRQKVAGFKSQGRLRKTIGLCSCSLSLGGGAWNVEICKMRYITA